MVRIRRLTSKPCSTKSFVTAANSSSFEAGLVARTSSTGSTRPLPMKLPQTRFTMVRANIGFFGTGQPLGEMDAPVGSGIERHRLRRRAAWAAAASAAADD